MVLFLASSFGRNYKDENDKIVRKFSDTNTFFFKT